jgi:hypothetical protein
MASQVRAILLEAREGLADERGVRPTNGTESCEQGSPPIGNDFDGCTGNKEPRAYADIGDTCA